MGHQQKVPQKILWRFDLIWLRYFGSENVYLFVCLFVCLLICLFLILIILGHPQEYTLKFREDLIWFSWDIKVLKLLICLFVWLFVYRLVCFLFKSSWDTQRNIHWKFFVNPTWFGWNIQDLQNVYLFVCWPVCFLFYSSWNTHRNIPGKFHEDWTWFGWDI